MTVIIFRKKIDATSLWKTLDLLTETHPSYDED